MNPLAEPAHKVCRCRHAESAHDELGCFWCKCKKHRYCRTTSIVVSNEIAVQEQSARLLHALFAEETKEAS